MLAAGPERKPNPGLECQGTSAGCGCTRIEDGKFIQITRLRGRRPCPTLGSPAAGLLGLQKGRYQNKSSRRPCQPHIPGSRCLHAPHLCSLGNCSPLTGPSLWSTSQGVGAGATVPLSVSGEALSPLVATHRVQAQIPGGEAGLRTWGPESWHWLPLADLEKVPHPSWLCLLVSPVKGLDSTALDPQGPDALQR